MKSEFRPKEHYKSALFWVLLVSYHIQKTWYMKPRFPCINANPMVSLSPSPAMPQSDEEIVDARQLFTFSLEAKLFVEITGSSKSTFFTSLESHRNSRNQSWYQNQKPMKQVMSSRTPFIHTASTKRNRQYKCICIVEQNQQNPLFRLAKICLIIHHKWDSKERDTRGWSPNRYHPAKWPSSKRTFFLRLLSEVSWSWKVEGTWFNILVCIDPKIAGYSIQIS